MWSLGKLLALVLANCFGFTALNLTVLVLVSQLMLALFPNTANNSNFQPNCIDKANIR